MGTAGSTAVSLVDWDGDGDLDAIVTNASPELKELWINDGRGRFALFSANNGQYDVFPPFYPTSDRDVDVGDLDGDGLPDAVFPINGVYLNRLTVAANGTIVLGTLRVDLPTASIHRPICRFVDLDGDGDLDVYLGRGFITGCCPDELFINSDGAGTLVASPFTLGPSQPSFDVVFKDIDGDGAIDAVICHSFSSNVTLWRSDPGDGVANFTFVGELGTPCDGLDIGDVTGDGIDDLIFVEFGGENSIWRGYGNFTFTDTGLRPGNSTFSASVRLGDLDGDGDLDAVIANTVGSLITGEPNEALINVDGLGTFTIFPSDPLSAPSGGALGKWFSTRPSLGDLDGDGTLDLFEANTVTQPNRVYKNFGAGLVVVADPSANATVGDQVEVQFDGSGAPNFILVPLDRKSKQPRQEEGVRVTLETIRETQGVGGTILKQVDVGSQTFTAFDNPGLGDVGLDFRANGSLGEQYEFRFSLFKQAAIISFGTQSYTVDADVNKITLCMGFWPFVNLTTSRLEFDILFQPAVPGAFTFDPNATTTTTAQGLERTVFQTSRGSSVVVALLDTVAVDGVVVTAGFTRTYTRPSASNDTEILLTLAFPPFEVELEYDPDVAVLVEGEDDGEKDNSLIIGLVTGGAAAILAGACLVVPLAICGLFVWKTRARWVGELKARNRRVGSVFSSYRPKAADLVDEYTNAERLSDSDSEGGGGGGEYELSDQGDEFETLGREEEEEEDFP